MVKLSYSMRVTQYYKFCIKDLIKNKIKVLAVFPSLFISLIVFALIIILRNELEYGINANSKILLGGGLEFSSKQKSFSNEKINKIRENYFVTEVIEFTSILRNENEKSKYRLFFQAFEINKYSKKNFSIIETLRLIF